MGTRTIIPFGPQHPVLPEPIHLDLVLEVNGTVRQTSNTRHMIFPIDRIVASLSEALTLDEGDLIFTGTPEGVASVVRGDILKATIHSVGSLTVTIG